MILDRARRGSEARGYDGCRAMNAHDPTNVNAVAGPSRLAYAAPSATTTSHTAAVQQPTATALDPSMQGRAGETAPIARKDPVRRADGPVIVPTRVDPVDNVRVVPQHFENCQLDDLISLIGESLLILTEPDQSADAAHGPRSLDARPPDRTQ